jgi:hypothetical protein
MVDIIDLRAVDLTDLTLSAPETKTAAAYRYESTLSLARLDLTRRAKSNAAPMITLYTDVDPGAHSVPRPAPWLPGLLRGEACGRTGRRVPACDHRGAPSR